MRRAALFSSLLPSDIRVLFGNSILSSNDSSISFFTTDHPGLKIFHDDDWALHHIRAFPRLYQKFTYHTFIYYLDNFNDFKSFEECISKHPGTLIIGNIQVIEQICGEVSPSTKRIIENCTNLIFLGPGQVRRAKYLLPKSSCKCLPPFFFNPSLTERIIHLNKKQSSSSKISLGLIHNQHDDGRVKMIRESIISGFKKFKGTYFITLFPIQMHADNIEQLIIEFQDYLEDIDLLLFGIPETSFIEYRLIAEAINKNIPTILPASSSWSFLPREKYLTIYPGRSEQIQWVEYLKTFSRVPNLLAFLREQPLKLGTFSKEPVSIFDVITLPCKHSMESDWNETETINKIVLDNYSGPSELRKHLIFSEIHST